MDYSPSSLLDAVRYFSDLKVCNDYMRSIKWPDGLCCHYCGSEAVYELSTRPVLKCRDCKKQFSYKVGTIFEDSPLGLDKWFVAVWAIANAKNGISSHELGRALNVTQKTAWFMLHRIREAMRSGTFRKLSGTVESDETFIGGEARNMHAHIREKKIRGRGSVGKRIVHGLLERDGEVRASVVDAVDPGEMHPIIISNVEKGANLYTDEHKVYTSLDNYFVHEVINHTFGDEVTIRAAHRAFKKLNSGETGWNRKSPRDSANLTSWRENWCKCRLAGCRRYLQRFARHATAPDSFRVRLARHAKSATEPA